MSDEEIIEEETPEAPEEAAPIPALFKNGVTGEWNKVELRRDSAAARALSGENFPGAVYLRSVYQNTTA